jgi:hypothetical protein
MMKEILWEKPEHDFLKLNTDAAFYTNGIGVAGMVLRSYCWICLSH